MSTRAQRTKRAVKTEKTVASKTTGARLTEEDKALDKERYVLNPNTQKHVLRDSEVGKKIIAGETPTKQPTLNEVLQNVVGSLQQIAPNVLTNAAIKNVICQIEGIPRTFPSEWGGKGKKPRPEGKPKGPQNAYIIYSSAVREQVKKKNPGVPNSAEKGQTSITSIIGDQWSKLSEKEKTKYAKLAEEDSERYEREMEEWEAENPELARKTTRTNNKQVRTNGWVVYQKKFREEFKKKNPGKTGREISTLLSEAWGELTDEQKEPYNQEASAMNAELPDQPANATPEKLSASEQAKADDPENYIRNPESGRYVLRSSKTGRKIVKQVEGVTDTPATTSADIVEEDAELLNE